MPKDQLDRIIDRQQSSTGRALQYTAGASVGGVSGAGVANNLAAWSGASTLKTSPVWMSTAGEVAIGTNQPLSGVRLRVVNVSTGAPTSITGVRIRFGPATGQTGTITDSYGLRVTLNKNGGGTVTNTYAVYVGQTGSGATLTNAWGVYVADSTLGNYISGSLGLVGTSSGTFDADFWINRTYTDNTTTHAGQDIFLDSVVTSDKSQTTASAFYRAVGTVSGSVTNSGAMYALLGQCYFQGAGTITTLVGSQIQAGLNTGGTGVITTNIGAQVRVRNNAAGTITTSYGVYVDVNGASGTITNNWGLYVATAAMRNYFAGLTKIGGAGTTPTGQLHVNQSSATAAIPTALLNQADNSEGFIDYTGTSAASAVGPISTWTTGSTVQGHVRVEINGTARWMRFYDAPTA